MNWSNLIFWSIGLGMGSFAGWRFRQPPEVSNPETRAAQALPEQLQKMRLAHRMATDMSQFKGSFLAQTSHELRSPLNSVISLHQLILSDLCDSPAEEREFVAQAHTATLKMLKLLDQLIHVSKVEHGTSDLQIQPLQLTKLIEEVWQLTHLQAQNRNLRLEIERPDSAVYVLADVRWLRQVLVSLVTASIALMPEGTIRVSTRIIPAANQAQILIEDQRPAGTGNDSAERHQAVCLEPEAIDKSLQPSLEPSPQLTLMISQTLMRLMQGQIEVLATPATEFSSVTAGTTALTGSSSAGAAPAADFTQICCSIPLAQVEPETISS